jgi:hypothetical protein
MGEHPERGGTRLLRANQKNDRVLDPANAPWRGNRPQAGEVACRSGGAQPAPACRRRTALSSTAPRRDELNRRRTCDELDAISQAARAL